jgi:hypothetical protein
MTAEPSPGAVLKEKAEKASSQTFYSWNHHDNLVVIPGTVEEIIW